MKLTIAYKKWAIQLKRGAFASRPDGSPYLYPSRATARECTALNEGERTVRVRVTVETV